MKTILVSAYAVNPFKGSEDGMGWNFIVQIARFNRVIAITRENNRLHIENYMAENPDTVYQNIQFLYFDLPYWMRFWKRKGQGALLYFWMWQKAIPGFVERSGAKFDLVHNLNFHNDWTPSYLWKLKKPMVWGPIGHHPRIPSRFLAQFHQKYKVVESITWCVKNIFWNVIPSVKSTARNAHKILAMNSSVESRFPLHTEKIEIMPSVATGDFGYSPVRNTDLFTVVSAGRLVPLKGFDLTILSFAAFLRSLPESEVEKCQLLIVGSGPEEETLRRLAEKSGFGRQIRFIEWMERKNFLSTLKSASCFLFPSHEGAGMVVAEALSFGLPVLCLNNCGPGEFIDAESGFAVPQGSIAETTSALAEGLLKLHSNSELLESMSQNARKRFEARFHWDRRGEQLQTIYQNLN